MGVTYLLDTHILVWMAGGNGPTLKRSVRSRLEADDARLHVSAVSAFEVATKVRLGKFDSARAVHDQWDTVLSRLGATALSLDTRSAQVAGTLDWDHRDPFDRLLAAQAITGGLTLVTADRAFRSVKGLDLLAW